MRDKEIQREIQIQREIERKREILYDVKASWN